MKVLSFRAGGVEGRPRGNDEWRSPTDLYARMDAEFHFAVDAACSSANCLAPEGFMWDRNDDGLLIPWGGSVWCNPPYSKVEPWVAKAAVSAAVVVMLLPADPSVGWWSRWVAPYADEVRFLIGRPRFRRPDASENITKRGGGGATTPCAIVIFRPNSGPPRYSYIPARIR